MHTAFMPPPRGLVFISTAFIGSILPHTQAFVAKDQLEHSRQSNKLAGRKYPRPNLHHTMGELPSSELGTLYTSKVILRERADKNEAL